MKLKICMLWANTMCQPMAPFMLLFTLARYLCVCVCVHGCVCLPSMRMRAYGCVCVCGCLRAYVWVCDWAKTSLL